MNLPTIKVKAADGQGFVIINVADFDGSKHVKWSEAPEPKPKTLEVKVEPQVVPPPPPPPVVVEAPKTIEPPPRKK